MSEIESKIREIDCIKEFACEPCIQEILALIAADRAEQCKLCEQLDKGLNEVMVDAVKRLKKQNKGLVEALELAESIVNDSTDARAAKCLAKIDSALKEVGK